MNLPVYLTFKKFTTVFIADFQTLLNMIIFQLIVRNGMLKSVVSALNRNKIISKSPLFKETECVLAGLKPIDH